MTANSGTSTRKDDSNATGRPNELSNNSCETPCTNCHVVSYQPNEDTKVQIETSMIFTESNQRKPMEKMEDNKKQVYRLDNNDRWPTSLCPHSQEIEAVVTNDLVKSEFGTGGFC